MITRKLRLILAFIFLFTHISFGQNKKEIALQKGNAAIDLVDGGKIDEGILLFEEAQRLDKDNINYPYELAYAYYMKKDYKKASKYLEGILNHKDVNNRVFQLLGNCYDILGSPEKAMAIYEDGLKRFPNSGNIYLEMGVIQIAKENYNKALAYFEKGIEVNPEFPSNYYWASKFFCNSSEEVWGMIYGELFMNLERNSKRTTEISKLLFDTYKTEIKITSDTSCEVTFSDPPTINIDNMKDFKLPFGYGVYGPTLLIALVGQKEINLSSLDKARTNFINIYFNNNSQKKYPNVLFEYQNEILTQGHMEAYNYWVLMKGNENEFNEWQSKNQEKWDSFVAWYTKNPIKLNKKNGFYRTQY